MARPNHEREPDDKKGSPPEAAAWGTWEELLLAYAVNRFGTNSWDSISSELRKRSTAPIVFTPKHCKQKYEELERRFGQSNGDEADTDDASGTAAATVPWIEELRKLRVAELQRELKNFDVYISSLQLKVKKLTEEGEKNGSGERNKKPDLGQKIDEIEIKNEEEGDNKPPDLVISGEEQVPGVDESDRDNQSMNGSNGNLEAGAEKSEIESSPVRTVDEKPGSSVHSPIEPEDLCKAKPDTKEPVKTEPRDGVSQEPESITESKSEGTVKENSDVQSSASKSMKERSDRVRRGSSKTDERENEDQSRNSIPVRSLPLIDILQKVHKLGSAFLERRLDRQEKLRYKNLIREHIDFEILQTRLKEGWYSDGNKNFFRDLLLLVNNNFIFFPNESAESIAAIGLRKFIMNEMAVKKKQKTDTKSSVKQTSSKPTTLPPKLVPPMIVCKKRSSISAKEIMNEKELSNEKESAFSLISKKNSKNNNKPVELEEKKRSAAKFLNRMKEGLSTSKNEAADVAAGGGSGNDGGGGGQKRGGEGKRGQRKEADSPAKKGVGRPPKKVAVGGGLGKRNREDGVSESLGLKQAKKKSKKL
ncbi:hypothetical protein L1887_22623 [Cichorium endivia]|nr:hypothetical protein L1887_22623 [Cichorium endivia]